MMPLAADRTSPDHQVHELTVYLDEIVRRVVATRRESTAFEALSRQEFAIVEALGRHGPLLVNHVAARVRLPMSTVSAATRQLTGKRLARRQPCATDRRLIRVELTPGGVALYRASLAARLELGRQILGTLEPLERSRLLALLRKALPSPAAL